MTESEIIITRNNKEKEQKGVRERDMNQLQCSTLFMRYNFRDHEMGKDTLEAKNSDSNQVSGCETVQGIVHILRVLPQYWWAVQ